MIRKRIESIIYHYWKTLPIKECHAFYTNYHTSPEFLVIYRFRLESIYIDDDIKYFIAIFVENPNVIIMNNFKPSFYSLVNWDSYK